MSDFQAKKQEILGQLVDYVAVGKGDMHKKRASKTLDQLYLEELLKHYIPYIIANPKGQNQIVEAVPIEAIKDLLK